MKRSVIFPLTPLCLETDQTSPRLLRVQSCCVTTDYTNSTPVGFGPLWLEWMHSWASVISRAARRRGNGRTVSSERVLKEEMDLKVSYNGCVSVPLFCHTISFKGSLWQHASKHCDCTLYPLLCAVRIQSDESFFHPMPQFLSFSSPNRTALLLLLPFFFFWDLRFRLLLQVWGKPMATTLSCVLIWLVVTWLVCLCEECFYLSCGYLSCGYLSKMVIWPVVTWRVLIWAVVIWVVCLFELCLFEFCIWVIWVVCRGGN